MHVQVLHYLTNMFQHYNDVRFQPLIFFLHSMHNLHIRKTNLLYLFRCFGYFKCLKKFYTQRMPCIHWTIFINIIPLIDSSLFFNSLYLSLLSPWRFVRSELTCCSWSCIPANWSCNSLTLTYRIQRTLIVRQPAFDHAWAQLTPDKGLIGTRNHACT